MKIPYKLKRTYPNKHLGKDVESVVGSIYQLNAPGYIAYGYEPNGNHRIVSRGEFLWRPELMTAHKAYSYLRFRNRKYYRIIEENE
jgi:hypothetical protein